MPRRSTCRDLPKLPSHVNLTVLSLYSELDAFYATSRSSDSPAYATYLLSGEVPPRSEAARNGGDINDDGMEVDDEPEAKDHEEEQVSQHRVTLVGEQNLEGASTQPVSSLELTKSQSCEVYILAHLLRTHLQLVSITAQCAQPLALI